MKRARWMYGLGATAVLAACSQPVEESAPEETAVAAAEETLPAQQLTPVDTAEEAPALEPLSRIEIEGELEPGAGCHIEQDGKNLLTAVEGDAIARPYGTLRHFEFEGDLEEMRGGGVFTAGAITIAVTPDAEAEGEQIGEVLVLPARVRVQEEGQRLASQFRAEWRCGA